LEIILELGLSSHYRKEEESVMEIIDLKVTATCDNCDCDDGVVQVIFSNQLGMLILCWDCHGELTDLSIKHRIL